MYLQSKGCNYSCAKEGYFAVPERNSVFLQWGIFWKYLLRSVFIRQNNCSLRAKNKSQPCQGWFGNLQRKVWNTEGYSNFLSPFQIWQQYRSLSSCVVWLWTCFPAETSITFFNFLTKPWVLNTGPWYRLVHPHCFVSIIQIFVKSF